MTICHLLRGIILQRYHVHLPLLGILISEFTKAQHHLPKQKNGRGSLPFLWKISKVKSHTNPSCRLHTGHPWLFRGGQTAPLNLPCNKKSPLKMEGFGRFFSKKDQHSEVPLFFASPSLRPGFSEVWKSHANSQHDGSIGMQFFQSVNGSCWFLIRVNIHKRPHGSDFRVAIWQWKPRTDWCSIEWHLGSPRNHTPRQWGQGTTSFTTLAAELCCNNVRGATMDAKPLRLVEFEIWSFFFVVKKCLFNLDLRTFGGWKKWPKHALPSLVLFKMAIFIPGSDRIHKIHHQRKRSKLEAGFSVNVLPPGFWKFYFWLPLKEPHKVSKKGNLLATNALFGRNTHDGKGC